jgi:hypothetical protein
MNDTTNAPSLLPDPPPEPVYVLRLRQRLREEINARRRVERENFRLRTELSKLFHKLAKRRT